MTHVAECCSSMRIVGGHVAGPEPAGLAVAARVAVGVPFAVPSPPLGPSPTAVARPSSSSFNTKILPSDCSSAVNTIVLSVGCGVIQDG